MAQAELGEGGLANFHGAGQSLRVVCEMLSADRCTGIAIGMLTFTAGNTLCYRGVQGTWGTAGTLCVSQRAQGVCSLMSGCSWLQSSQVGRHKHPYSMDLGGWSHPSLLNGIFAESFNQVQTQILHWLQPWNNSGMRTRPACLLSQLLLPDQNNHLSQGPYFPYTYTFCQ